jgi:hypothetical protein
VGHRHLPARHGAVCCLNTDQPFNDYLIVGPVDQSGRRWVQGQIASPEWTRSAHFGQGDTLAGMRYRIYVLSTSTALPIGELTKQTDSPQESPAITVTLKK